MGTIYYCLNGIGYFGSRSLLSAIQLMPYLENDNNSGLNRHRLELFALSDTSEDTRKSIVTHLAAVNIDTTRIVICRSISDIFTAIKRKLDEGVGDDAQFVIHDCSPTHVHLTNLQMLESVMRDIPAFGSRVRYLVEKPAFTAVQHQMQVEAGPVLELPPNCHCDYIELKSRTFLTAKRWMQEHSFQPTHLHVWRNSGTGFKKVFSKSRHGVTGGALEDKAVHDLALTLGYFGPPQLPVTVGESQFENLMPAPWGQDDTGRPRFITAADLVVQNLDRRHLPLGGAIGSPPRENEEDLLAFDIADARVFAQLDWAPSAKPSASVACSYSFSWDGIDRSLHASMASHGIPPEDYVGKDTVVSPDQVEVYTVEEARIHILEDRRPGKREALILNYLSKYGSDPWIYHAVNGRTTAVPVGSPYGGDNSLFRILLSVITDTDNTILGRETTRIVSEIAHRMRSVATNTAAPDPVTSADEVRKKFVDRSRFARRRRIGALVFDLDNTLLDTAAIEDSILDPVIQAVERTSPTRTADWLSDLRKTLMWRPLDDPTLRASTGLGVTESELETMRVEFRRLEVVANTTVRPFDDAAVVIPALAGLPGERVHLALLTRGFRRLQQSKIDRFGLGDYFGDNIYIDDVDAGPTRPGQLGYLLSLTKTWDMPASRFLVVGDNQDAELRAALDLGMETAYIVRAESRERVSGPDESSIVHRQISDLRTVVEITMQS